MKNILFGVDDSDIYDDTVIPNVKSIKLNTPLEVQWEITDACNYRCRFCYNVWKNEKPSNSSNLKTVSGDLSLDAKKEIAKRIKEMNVFGVMISGGEPLLDEHLLVLLDYFQSVKIETSIITNGSLLTFETCKNLQKAGLTGMQISLHSAKPEVSDWITRKKDSLELTIRGIENAINVFGGYDVGVNMVVTDQNYLEIPKMISLVKKLGVKSFSIGSLSSTGDAITTCQKISKKQFQESCKILVDAGEKEGIKVGVTGGFPHCILADTGIDADKIAANYCDAGLNQLVISASGDLRPCVCFPQIVGSILDDNYLDIWHNASFLKFLRNLEHVPKKCHKCDKVAICKGGCRAAAFLSYGDFESIDPIGV